MYQPFKASIVCCMLCQMQHVVVQHKPKMALSVIVQCKVNVTVTLHVIAKQVFAKTQNIKERL